MFFYYKDQEKIRAWSCAEEDQRERIEAIASTGFTTVLAVSEKTVSASKGGTISDKAVYSGPFYVDIDSDAIENSIVSVKKVLKKLESFGVPFKSLSVWASGKKGFHITVPMEVFSDGTPQVKLPLAYKMMAIKMGLFEIESVDKTVYSCGRGRMWRVAGKKRIDNEKYKVSLNYGDIEDMDKEGLDALVCRSRPAIPVQPVKSEVLESLYKNCVRVAAEAVKPKAVFVDSALLDMLQDQLPPCVEDLKNFRNIKPNKGFNDISLQFGKGVAAFSGNHALHDIDEFAQASTGTSYKTVESRKTHCMTAYRLSLGSVDYEWKCSSVLSVIKNHPCNLCPIKFIKDEENDIPKPDDNPKPKKKEMAVKDAPHSQEQDDDQEGNQEGLIETSEGYGFIENGKFRRICNFYLRLDKLFVEYIPSKEEDIRVSVSGKIFIAGKDHGTIKMDELTSWTKSGIIAAVAGHGNAGFYGKDDDVQRLKVSLMEKADKFKSVRRVTSVGIHSNKVGDDHVFTYVEPGWSVDQYGNENEYKYDRKPTLIPKLKSAQILEKGCKKTSYLLNLLLDMNQPHTIAQLLGWTMACFLRLHIKPYRNEFPLISLYGEPGSGKTTTSKVFAALHGLNYSEISPLSLPSTRNFGLWSFISESQTFPVLCEEFNKSALGRNFKEFENIFKDCYNCISVSRGALSGATSAHGKADVGAVLVQIPLSGPVMIQSEQRLTGVALVDRTVQVAFSKKDKDVDLYRKSYLSLAENLEEFQDFAKTCYGEAIHKTVPEVISSLKRVGKVIPQNIKERPRNCFEVCLLGLDFLKEIVDKYELGCKEKLAYVTAEFVEWLVANEKSIAASKTVSEVDMVLNKVSFMAAAGLGEIDKNVNYLIKDGYLYLDSVVIHGAYKRYVVVNERQAVAMENLVEFVDMVSREDYCVDSKYCIPNFANGRKLLQLDLEKMGQKNVDYSGFKK